MCGGKTGKGDVERGGGRGIFREGRRERRGVQKAGAVRDRTGIRQTVMKERKGEGLCKGMREKVAVREDGSEELCRWEGRSKAVAYNKTTDITK